MSTARQYEVTSEVAYDLMQDHLDTILALLERPLLRGELVERLGSEVVLQRLLGQGLVVAEGDTFSVVSNRLHQVRQEGMVTFLERYLLPALSASTHEQNDSSGFATLSNRLLRLDVDTARGLRQGPVQRLFEELSDIVEGEAQGVVSRLSLLVVGTSRVVGEPLESADAALRHLQQASLQRVDAAERELAVVSQIDFLADNKRYAAAIDALDRFAAQFDSLAAENPHEASYHLTVASHWQGASAGVPATVARQIC